MSQHNGADPTEAARIHTEHPGEDRCVENGRVLGAIAVTRGEFSSTIQYLTTPTLSMFNAAIGDHTFKLPSAYTSHCFLHSNPGFQVHFTVEEFTKLNITPPYLTAEPEIVHRQLVAPTPTGTGDRFLILASDGLTGQYFDPETSELGLIEAAEGWVRVVVNAFEDEGTEGKSNTALALLRSYIGGEDIEVLSRNLGLDMGGNRWMDDCTIRVIIF